MDFTQALAAGFVQRSGPNLLQQLLDHGADPHHLRGLLDHGRNLVTVVSSVGATLSCDNSVRSVVGISRVLGLAGVLGVVRHASSLAQAGRRVHPRARCARATEGEVGGACNSREHRFVNLDTGVVTIGEPMSAGGQSSGFSDE
ncbi:MAG TPA: hypothetical protein VH373_04195 [Jatrophihabitantaceae bacterium]